MDGKLKKETRLGMMDASFVVADSMGNSYFFCCVHKLVESPSTNPPNSPYVYYWLNGDMIVLKITPDNEIAWSQSVLRTLRRGADPYFIKTELSKWSKLLVIIL